MLLVGIGISREQEVWVSSYLTPCSIVTPNLPSLARWEPLLLPSFSGPTLEQDGDTPSYGLLLALANVSVRTLARDGASQRSPSPGR